MQVSPLNGAGANAGPVDINEVIKRVPPGTPVKIGRVNTNAATASPIAFNQIMENIKRPLPRLHNLPEFKKVKGFDKPIALVGGGPSLKGQLDKLRKLRTIMTAGSSHDFLINSGITPSYSVICDPDVISSYYLTKADTEVKYLVSTNCHSAVFDAVQGKQIIMWHCHSDDEYTQEVIKVEKNYEGVGGGCTVGLRAISIAIMFGYSNIHLFGYDSCLGEGDGAAYAYKLDDRDNMLDLLGTIYPIKIGTETAKEKVYNCLGYQVGQAQHFLDFFRRYNEYFKCTFHGGGLLSDLYDLETGVTQ